MARRSVHPKPTKSPLAKGRRSTQRERIVAGMITAANRDGYAGASVSAVIAEAGVSRPTFYEYFADRDACFLATIVEVHQQLMIGLRERVRREAPELALRAGVCALIELAVAEPAMARFLMNESLAGGAAALDARDRSIGEIEQLVEQRYADLKRVDAVPDFSTRMLIGGIYRLLAVRTRRGDPNVSSLLEDLLNWLSAYDRPLAAHRWRSLERSASLPSSPFLPDPLRAPPPLPPGRPRISSEEVADNHRRRVLFAAALLAEQQGYTATTVADICKLAGIDLRAFYAMFADKQEAFMAVHELGFQDLMAVTAGAFFAGTSWPERIWEAARALTQFLESNPTIAHVGFVEAHAVGPGAVQRVEDSHVAFTIFLQEGFQYAQPSAPPSRAALEAIITTIFEIVYSQTRAGGDLRLSGLVPHLSFLALAPFVGPERADALIEEMLAAGP
ncbi:MAG TPA: TetR/AcrR family transcriptional regulator [Solirubrobacteraceae bacterium]|jgi:AcrR family transcriptional regulator|nr:TetR/AcrR family transcriptional regulator [Solirubrobacteraceae bacterium]